MHSFFPQITAKFKTYGSACPLFSTYPDSKLPDSNYSDTLYHITLSFGPERVSTAATLSPAFAGPGTISP
jgi:hypothetical protein